MDRRLVSTTQAPACWPNMNSDSILRVLVVDDSAYLRKVLSDMLAQSPRLQVVGTARNGYDALEKVRLLQPDVITLDLLMDGLDGVGFLKIQMHRKPLPVVVCSIASEDGELVVAAMEAGAVEFVRKPTALAVEELYQMAGELVQKVILAGSILRDRLPGVGRRLPGGVLQAPQESARYRALVLGLSTGGPQALRYLLERLPSGFPVPVAAALHMPRGYTGPLAERLNSLSALEVLEASQGLEMCNGRMILAQAGYHLRLAQTNQLVVADLDHAPLDSLHLPSVDVLFKSAAEVYHGRVLAVVLTGMGDDGTTGAAWIKAQGGTVFTEAEESCVVYGMPRRVVEAGLSDRSIPLEKIAEAIVEAM